MKDIALFVAAAFFEIAGCFSLWLYLRQHKPMYWIFVRIISLFCFAYLLTRVEIAFAGRAYAVYGGIYILASLLWLLVAEHVVPDKWDIIGASICLLGALIIFLTPR
ncbi:MAG: YnfA family protein [Bacteroidales bacterium]